MGRIWDCFPPVIIQGDYFFLDLSLAIFVLLVGTACSIEPIAELY
jgi:hypothetical protein